MRYARNYYSVKINYRILPARVDSLSYHMEDSPDIFVKVWIWFTETYTLPISRWETYTLSSTRYGYIYPQWVTFFWPCRSGTCARWHKEKNPCHLGRCLWALSIEIGEGLATCTTLWRSTFPNVILKVGLWRSTFPNVILKRLRTGIIYLFQSCQKKIFYYTFPKIHLDYKDVKLNCTVNDP